MNQLDVESTLCANVMPGVMGLLAELGESDPYVATETIRITYADEDCPFRIMLLVGRGPKVKLEIFNLHAFARDGYRRETLFEIVGIYDEAGNPFGPDAIATGLKRYQDVPSSLTLWMPTDEKHELVLCQNGRFTAVCDPSQERREGELRRFQFRDFRTFETALSLMMDAARGLPRPARTWRWLGGWFRK